MDTTSSLKSTAVFTSGVPVARVPKKMKKAHYPEKRQFPIIMNGPETVMIMRLINLS